MLIWYSAEAMYGLVTAVDRYPEFLPWCDHTEVMESTPEHMRAAIGIAFAGVRQRFVTHNQHVPGREVHVRLVEGPFSRLDGHWRFQPIEQGGGGSNACRVELKLDYGFDSDALALVVGPVFGIIATSLVDAFVKRAEQVYG